MPGTFLLAIITAVIAIGCAAGRFALKGAAARETAPRGRYDDPAPSVKTVRTGLTVAAGAFAGLAVILVLLSSWNPVPTQDIGIVTSFGQPLGHLGAGANWTAPWEQVTQMDEAIQVTDSTFTVRIAGGQTAQATIQARWRISPAAADDVFRNYKNSTSGVENGLLTPELNAAANSVLDGYDPLTPLATAAPAGSPGNPTTTQLAAQIQSTLNGRVGADVEIITLVLKPLVYDGTVQARINSVLAQTAKTDVAKQSEVTAQAQARANQIAEAALTANPLVLVQQCMNAIADGQLNPPAGFSCWPGSGSGVVIPSATTAR